LTGTDTNKQAQKTIQRPIQRKPGLLCLG